MEEIKVGEYVRTKDGQILKIDSPRDMGYLEEGFPYFRQNIIKHSKNITDLIEVGDILRIKVQFHHKIEPRYMLEEIKDKKTSTWKNILEQIDLCHYEIIEILTKEQYNANCYRLEE